MTLEADEKTSKENKWRFFYVWEGLYKWLLKLKEVTETAYDVREK